MTQTNDIKTYPYRYFSNGFVLDSEIKFPELAETTAAPTATLSYGNVPESIENARYTSPLQQISDDTYLLNIKNTGRYMLKGNAITVQAYDGISEDALRVFILSSVFGVLIHKSNMLPMHASCIKVKEGCVLVSGHSGAGKSTLALGLHKLGYEILNDDISTVTFNEGQPEVFPGYVHIKLWAESLLKYGYQTEGFRKLRTEMEKYSYPLQRAYTETPVPLKAIFLLHSQNQDELSVSQVEGRKVFNFLKKETFRFNLVKHLKKEGIHFSLCSQLAQKVPVFKVTRPASINPAEFAVYFEEQLKAL